MQLPACSFENLHDEALLHGESRGEETNTTRAREQYKSAVRRRHDGRCNLIPPTRQWATLRDDRVAHVLALPNSHRAPSNQSTAPPQQPNLTNK